MLHLSLSSSLPLPLFSASPPLLLAFCPSCAVLLSDSVLFLGTPK